MEPKEPFLSVIIPAYNEEKNIDNTIKDVHSFLSKKGITHEIIVVDDGSRDQTSKIVQQLRGIKNLILLENWPNRGKGYAIRRGIMKSRGEIVMFMDADSATNIREIEKFLPYFPEYDMVIASRRIKGAKVNIQESLLRRILGKIYIYLSRLLIIGGISDYNCGFKVYKAHIAKNLFSIQKMNDWCFDTEVIFLARKFGYSIKEVPVSWYHRPDTSKVHPIRDGIKSFIGLLKIKINDIKGRYKLKHNEPRKK